MVAGCWHHTAGKAAEAAWLKSLKYSAFGWFKPLLDESFMHDHGINGRFRHDRCLRGREAQPPLLMWQIEMIERAVTLC